MANMTQEEKNTIYEEALSRWGFTAQAEMVIEECSELILAFQKLKRKQCRETVANLHEELADVEIMLEQMRVYAKKNMAFLNEEEIERYKEQKLIRLKKRLEIE